MVLENVTLEHSGNLTKASRWKHYKNIPFSVTFSEHFWNNKLLAGNKLLYSQPTVYGHFSDEPNKSAYQQHYQYLV